MATRFSIGGNHLNHAARKNIKLTYVIMDNFVYGLTKKQTSPTSPIGFKSKTDPTGAIDRPINPMKQLLATGATFIARTHATQVNHMVAMMERAMDHDGFSVVECLSECVEFYPGAFDRGNPAQRRRLQHHRREEKRRHARGRSAPRRDRRNRRLQTRRPARSPGCSACFTRTIARPKTRWRRSGSRPTRAKTGGASDLELLQKTFDRMK